MALKLQDRFTTGNLLIKLPQFEETVVLVKVFIALENLKTKFHFRN